MIKINMNMLTKLIPILLFFAFNFLLLGSYSVFLALPMFYAIDAFFELGLARKNLKVLVLSESKREFFDSDVFFIASSLNSLVFLMVFILENSYWVGFLFLAYLTHFLFRNIFASELKEKMQESVGVFEDDEQTSFDFSLFFMKMKSISKEFSRIILWGCFVTFGGPALTHLFPMFFLKVFLLEVFALEVVESCFGPENIITHACAQTSSLLYCLDSICVDLEGCDSSPTPPV